jgi:hypothetical protein
MAQSTEDFRRIWPFFRDRRIDAYGGPLQDTAGGGAQPAA